MASLGGAAGVLGRVKACNACRQLKLRCDAHDSRYSACSRCRKTGRSCVMSASFKRQHRETKAELEREVSRLRAKYESSSSLLPSAVPLGQPNPPPIELNEQPSPRHPAQPEPTPLGMDGGILLPSSSRLANQSSLGGAAWIHLRQHDVIDAGQSPVPTTSQGSQNKSAAAHSRPLGITSRGLGGVEVSAKKVDDCVASFRKNYAPSIPGLLDDDMSPDALYDYSKFLFWTVVYVGARDLSRDPTLVERLTRPVKELAQSSLFDPDHAIPSIQAALILCLWRFPVASTFKDPVHAIAGAAMQLAIQKGLAFSSRKQDFFRIPLKQNDADVLFRARLWAYCVTVFQSTSLYDGLPPPMTILPADLDEDQAIVDGLPSSLRYSYRLHRVLAGAFASILQTTNLNLEKDGDLLNSLVSHFDTQAQQVFPAETGDLGRFTLCCTRLVMRAFHFFTAPSSQRTAGILQTYFISCEIIEISARLDRVQDFGSHCNSWQARAGILAAVCILRILRSNLDVQINTQIGEDMYFEAIRLSKKRSVRNYDPAAKMTTVLTQLWSYTRLFQFHDGRKDGVRLLLRGRLSMSVVFDCVWWWRAQFDGKSNPYVAGHPPTSAIKSPRSAGSTLVEQNLESASELNPDCSEEFMDMLMDASGLPDWNWEELGIPQWNWC